MQIFYYFSCCIWNSWKCFGYFLNFETKEIVEKQLLLFCFISRDLWSGILVVNFAFVINTYFEFYHCLIEEITSFFAFVGIYMMLIISILRYRATVYPLKAAINRRKLKIVCGLGYILGLIAEYEAGIPLCLKRNDAWTVHDNSNVGYTVSSFYLFPIIFTAVVCYKICRALIKQNKHMKRVCSNALRSSYLRQTFLVCVGTVLCYGISIVPISVFTLWSILGHPAKYFWILYFSFLLRVTG